MALAAAQRSGEPNMGMQLQSRLDECQRASERLTAAVALVVTCLCWEPQSRPRAVNDRR